MAAREPLSHIHWLTPVSRRWDVLGVPVRVDGYNWKRKVRVHVLAGPGRGQTFFAFAIDLAHDHGRAALNTALAALAFLPSTGHDVDPGCPVVGPKVAQPAPARDGDPLEGALL
jgi:hypothetical protein